MHDREIHQRLRDDGVRWNALPFVGIQHGAADLSYVLELRNCTCGSTLGRRIQEETMKFQIYKDKTSLYRWRLLAANSQIMADSGESYSRREDIHNAIVALQASIPVATIVDA